MSILNYKNKQLRKEEARKLIVKLAAEGKVYLTKHAPQRLRQRNVIFNDILNVLQSKSMRVDEAELTLAGYNYRCFTRKFAVVIGFTVKGDGVVVITVFKLERKA